MAASFRPKPALTKLFSIAAGLALAATFGTSVFHQGAASSFDREFPDFVQNNRKIIQERLRQPKSKLRDRVIETARQNLRWAAQYGKVGFDPEIFEEMRAAEESGSPDQRVYKSQE
ncbi:hypothetical protein EON81_13120 [bacterium]|nr:MAG: hypothetical protein EON81_13120 [bacterium]